MVAALLVAVAFVWTEPAPAEAFSVDATGTVFTFDYSPGGNGTLLSGGAPTSSGAVVQFSTVTTIDGVAIDAIVTTTLSGATVGNYDNIGSASSNKPYFQVNNASTAAGGFTAFTFDFYEHGSYTGPGTGTPVTLRNVAVTSIDIDGPGIQFQDFVGYQSYVLNSSTGLHATDMGAGVTRFEQSSDVGNHSNIPEDAVQVRFDAVSSFTAKFGNESSGQTGYFGVAFMQLADVFPASTPAAPVDNPSNRPPTSNDTTRYVVTSQPSILQVSDFGTFADPDNNPFVAVKVTSVPAAGTLEKYVAGTWQAVNAGDDVAVADIQNGNLRYTGSVDDALQFTVNDGLAYSAAAYTMSLLVSDQAQTITFTNPGTKLPTDPAFASGATASSGLPVTLTSLTPGVCTVSGLDVDPVAEGSCTVVATQAGNPTYGAADPVTQTFPVSTKTAQTITAPNPGNQSPASLPSNITVAPTATSGLTVTVVSLTPDVCTVSGFTVSMIALGNCTLRNTQPGNGTYAPAPQVQYTFQVLAAADPTLTYDANGADSGSVPSSQTGAGSVTLSGNTGSLVRAGYTFGGWTIGASTYAGGDSYSLSTDATAYAIWDAVAPSYTLTYNDGGADSGSVPSSQTGSGSVTLAADEGSLVRAGYTFAGWTIGATTYAGGDSYSLAADVTAYATWNAVAPSYTLTYDDGGADSGAVPSAQTGSGSVTVSGNTGSLVRSGYTFGGWIIGASTYAGGASYSLAANVTAYAVWNAVTPTYTLSFSPNGADSGSAPAASNTSGTITLPTTDGMARTGYTFTGWLINGVTYAPGTEFVLSENITAVAVWTPIATGAGNLAMTGSDVEPQIALALGLLLGGAALVGAGVWMRRRA